MKKWHVLLFVGVLVPAGQASDDKSFGCLIEPSSVIDLSTREEGIVESILAARGDVVESGQVVVQLEADVEKASVALAEARAQMDAELAERRADVGLTRRELARIENLFEKKVISLTEKDRAATEARRAQLRLRQTQHQRKLAQLEFERARKILKRRTLVSPVAGIVVERLLSPGESVENTTILRIAEVDPLNVEVLLPVERFGAVKAGQQAEVSPRYPGAEVQTATVSVVDNVIDPASDTFGVRLVLPNTEFRVPAGVRCGIRFLPTVAD